MIAAHDRIVETFHDAGCRGWLHARRVDRSGPIVNVNGHEPVVAASVYKLVVLVAAAQAFDAGRLEPHSRIRVVPSDCTPGPTGLSTFSDPITLSWLDLTRSMITVSDNAAADLLLAGLGMHSIEQVIADFGLTTTRVRGGGVSPLNGAISF